MELDGIDGIGANLDEEQRKISKEDDKKERKMLDPTLMKNKGKFINKFPFVLHQGLIEHFPYFFCNFLYKFSFILHQGWIEHFPFFFCHLL